MNIITNTNNQPLSILPVRSRWYRMLVWLLLLGIGHPVQAQIEQKGIVYEIDGNRQRKPLPFVEIIAANASSVVSGRDGTFTLNFRQLKPGHKINIRSVYKAGYEILNDGDLDQLYITPEGTAITILMIKSSTFAHARANLQGKVDKQMQKQLEKSQRDIILQYKKNSITEAEYRKRMRELETNYEKQLLNIDHYIDRFLRIDVTHLTKLERDIIGLVRKGKFNEAIALYEQANLIDQYIQQSPANAQLAHDLETIDLHQQQLRAQRRQILVSIDRQIDLLRMEGSPENINLVNKMLYDIAMADTTEFDPMFRYARDCRSLFRYQESYNAYQQLEKRASHLHDTLQQYRAQMFKGLVQMRLGQALEGYHNLKEGLRGFDHYNSLSADSLRYLADVAYGYERLGKRQSDYYQYDDAVRSLRLGLRKLAFLNEHGGQYADEESLAQYGRMLVTTGQLFSRSRYVNEAERLIKHGLMVIEPLHQKKNYLYVPSLALGYRSLGQLYFSFGDSYQEACEEAYLTALRYYATASRFNPEAYVPMEAECRYLLGDHYLLAGAYDRAIECYKWSENVWNADQTDRFNTELSQLYFDLGKCYYLQGNYPEALRYDVLALDVTRPLYEQEPIVYKEQMGTCLLHMANVHHALGHLEQALDYCRQAMGVDPTYRETRELLRKLTDQLNQRK